MPRKDRDKRNEYKRQWRKNNPEKYKAQEKRRRVKKREYARKYRAEHREAFSTYLKRYREKHLTEIKEKEKIYVREHKDERNAARRKRYARDPEYRAKIANYKKKNRKRNVEKQRQYNKKCKRLDRMLLRDSYIKFLFCDGSNLRHSDIPPELIEAKRMHIKLLREVQQQ